MSKEKPTKRSMITDELVCKAVQSYASDRSRFPYDYLAEWTGAPLKVCYRALERACDHGLIDYGVSLRTGWLTEKGEALLKERGRDERER